MKAYINIIITVAITAGVNSYDSIWLKTDTPEQTKANLMELPPTAKHPDWALKGNYIQAGSRAKEVERNDKVSEVGLGKAEATWELPSELREVSGIAMLPDGIMACVQDEAGVIYMYDLENNKIIQKINFAGPGDYEGLALVNNSMFILRSDGVLFEVKNFRSEKPTVSKYESNLASTQNTEGLAYDKANNRLLIACKGYDKSLKDAKSIYAFSLSDKAMQETPAIVVPVLQEPLTTNAKRKKNSYDYLQPSSLEIHPVTGDIYMLDAVNNQLVVIDEKGQIKKIANLPKKLFRQAEGISFGSNGEMFIASEGKKKGKGVLVKYPSGI